MYYAIILYYKINCLYYMASLEARVAQLTEFNSEKRGRAIHTIVESCITDVSHLNEALGILPSLQGPYVDKVTESLRRKTHKGFKEGSSPPTVQDMGLIIDSLNGPHEQVMLDALGGLFERPQQHFNIRKPTQDAFKKAYPIAVQVFSSFAEAVAKCEDPEKKEKILSIYRDAVVPSRDSNAFFSFQILNYGIPDMPYNLVERAYATKVLLDAEEIRTIGDISKFSFTQDQLDTIERIEKAGITHGKFETSLAYKVAYLIHEVLDPLIKGDEKLTIFCAEPEDDRFCDFALERRTKQMAIWLSNKSKDGKQLRGEIVLLPGKLRAFTGYRNDVHISEVRSLQADLMKQRIINMRSEEKPHNPITMSEFNTVTDYLLPPIENVEQLIDIETTQQMKERAQCGLYSLSQRGAHISFDHSSEQFLHDAGLDHLVLKQLTLGRAHKAYGKKVAIPEGRADDYCYIAEFTVLGQKMAAVIDADFNFIPPTGLGSHATSWLERISFAYLADLRNLDESQATEENRKTSSSGEIKFLGRTASLHVLPLDARPTIDAQTEREIRRRFTHIGHKELNRLFTLVQINRDFLDTIPEKSIRDLLSKLLQRVHKKVVEGRPMKSTWTAGEEDTYGTRIPSTHLQVNNPPHPDTYSPLYNYFQIAYVPESEADPNAPPIPFNCPHAAANILPT